MRLLIYSALSHDATTVVSNSMEQKRFSETKCRPGYRKYPRLLCDLKTYDGVSKSFRTGRLERELQMV